MKEPLRGPLNHIRPGCYSTSRGARAADGDAERHLAATQRLPSCCCNHSDHSSVIFATDGESFPLDSAGMPETATMVCMALAAAASLPVEETSSPALCSRPTGGRLNPFAKGVKCKGAGFHATVFPGCEAQLNWGRAQRLLRSGPPAKKRLEFKITKINKGPATTLCGWPLQRNSASLLFQPQTTETSHCH